MDCRTTLLLGACLSCGGLGCAQVPQIANCCFSTKEPAASTGKPNPKEKHGAATYVAVAVLREREAGNSALRKAQEFDPENRFITQTLGFCLARAGHIQESLEMLSKVMTPVEVHYNVARMLFQIQRDDLSLMHLQIALQIDPNYEPAREMLT